LNNINQIENKLNKLNNTNSYQSPSAPFNNSAKIYQEASGGSRLDGSAGNSLNFMMNRDSSLNAGSVAHLYENLEYPLSEILFWQLKEFVKEKFDTALFAKTTLEQILEITIKLAEDIIMIKDKVVQVFPPKYNIFDRYFNEYQENIFNTLYPFVKDENEKYLEENKGDLIQLAKWLDKYEGILRKVGIDVNQCEIGAVELFIFN
jgi:hypothetical protein